MKFGKSVRLCAMLCLTGSFFLVEIIVGYATNSMALVADSFHMLSDVVALLVGLFSVRIAKKKSEHNTFGWARAEVLGALVNAVFLCALCFTIFVEAVQRFTEDNEVRDPKLVLIVGCVGLAVNIIGLFLFHDHGHGHSHGHGHGHDHHHEHHLDHLQVDVESPRRETDVSTTGIVQVENLGNGGISVPDTRAAKKKTASGSQMNMHGVFLHVAGDALGSVVVIIAAVVIWQTDYWWRHYIDPAMSLLSVIVILSMTIPLLRSSALILLQTVPLHMKARDIRARLEKIQGVTAVHELHLWQLAGTRNVASAHIWCKNFHEYQRAANRIKEFFHNEGIHSTTIQPEFEELGENYYENVQNNPAFCMLTCPGDKTCQENLCCLPPSIPRAETPLALRHSASDGAILSPVSRSLDTHSGSSSRSHQKGSIALTTVTRTWTSAKSTASPKHPPPHQDNLAHENRENDNQAYIDDRASARI